MDSNARPPAKTVDYSGPSASMPGGPGHFRFQTRKAVKVLVCGGRNFRSPAQVFRALDRLHQEKPITELMQGGATGADQFAMEWAATKPEIKRYVCNADWETHGRAAGPIRNEKMLTWKPDL